jgi:L-lactate dehydrogenase complex protein LldG
MVERLASKERKGRQSLVVSRQENALPDRSGEVVFSRLLTIDYRLNTMATEQVDALVAEFAARLQPLTVRVERVPDSERAATVLAEVAREIEAPGLVVAAELTTLAPELMAALEASETSWLNPADVAATRDAPLGISLAVLGVAETGSVMMAEPTLTDRAVGMLTKTNVVIVRTETMVPSLDEAAAALRAVALQPNGGYAALVTGPSRTADIELSLSLGVQGPERVVIVVVDALT